MGRASRQKKVREDTPAAGQGQRARLRRKRVSLVGDAPAAGLNALGIAALAGLAALAYLPCLSGEFVFDDNNAILQSLLVRKIWPLMRFVTYSNRPLVDFTYALNYAQNGYDTWWFHATNIILHAATAIVLYLLALRTLRLPAFADRYAERCQPIAWIAAAIFACHPLASDTVAYIASRSEGIAGFFYLLTMLVYAIAVTAEDSSKRTLAKYALPVVTALAVGSKEIAVTIPLALILYDFVFVAEADRRSTTSRLSIIGFSVIPLLLGGAYFAFRAFLSDQLMTPYQQSAGFGFDQFTPIQYLSTQFGVLLHYLRLLVVPTGLNMDYDWPLSRSPFELRPIVSFLVLAAATYAILPMRRSQPFLFFSFFFFLLVVAPTSSIMPLADLAVERRMYIPLAGFSLLAGTAAWDLSRWLLAERGMALVVTMAVATLAIFTLTTRARATQWGDHLLLYQDTVEKSPGSPRVRLNLGVILLNAGRHDEAHEVLFEARRLYDEGKSIHAFPRIGAFINYNLGAIQYIRQDYDDSLRYMRDAIEIGGHYVALRPRAYAVIGHIFKMRENYPAAEEAFTEALKFNKDHPEWIQALADVQISLGKAQEARQTLFRLHLVHPEVKGSAESNRLLENLAALQKQLRAARR